MLPRIVLTWLMLVAAAQAAPRVDFKRDVYPILKSRCFKCHQGSNPDSGVRLDHHAKLLGETDGTPLIRIGKSKRSLLMQVVRGQIKGKLMPPQDAGAPLTAKQINTLARWIDQGARWDERLLPDPNLVAARKYWAFRRVTRPSVPKASGHPIDAFVAARLKARGLSFAPRAKQQTLLRRLALVLTGMPLPAKDLRAALNDKSPLAFKALVEQLLTSPHYGERMARHWLDYARWAESEGFAQNNNRDFAWRYRDYVTRSFNLDKSYAQFIRQQIAGDELEPYSDENVVATGYLAAARISADDLHFYRAENDMYVDIVNTVSSSILGLTVGCSQCHDHKFDPISQRDFYRLKAFFTRGFPGNIVLAKTSHPARLDQVARDLLAFDLKVRKRVIGAGAAEQPPSVQSILRLSEPQRNLAQERLFRPARIALNIRIAGCNGFRIKPDEKKKLAQLRGELKKLVGQAAQTWGFYSPVTSPHRLATLPMAGNFPLLHDKKRLQEQRSYLLKRGRVFEPVATVTPGWPSAFGPAQDKKLKHRPRTALADWLTSRKNPLTARVWVNRIWQMHFGRGLVETAGNFGVRGTRPSHPKLLDWLAAELMDHKWSTKHIHRLIVTSQTWQQSARGHSIGKRRDPDNRLLWRWPRRRLEYEAIRDSMLLASGELDRTVGGASVKPKQPGHLSRRSLYLHQRRDGPPAMQELFDGPTAMSESCSMRRVSTSPLQSLFLLNNRFAADRAAALARRVAAGSKDPHKQIKLTFELALGRQPDPVETKAAQAFLSQFATENKQQQKQTPAAGKALTLFCQAVLNLSEFMYLE